MLGKTGLQGSSSTTLTVWPTRLVLASCVAVAGLGIKVVKVLDDLMSRWDVAHLSLILKSTVETFTNSLQMLRVWMDEKYLESGAATDLTFVRCLAVSCEGCMRFLLALKFELESIAPKPWKLGPLSWRKKTAIMWNENRIKDLRDHLITCSSVATAASTIRFATSTPRASSACASTTTRAGRARSPRTICNPRPVAIISPGPGPWPR